MNTTKRVFRSVAQIYVAGILTEDFTQEAKPKLELLVEDFNKWYQKQEPMIKRIAIREYLQSRPTTINLEYTYDGFQKAIKDWFQVSNVEYVERSKEVEENFYYHTITIELVELCRREKVYF